MSKFDWWRSHHGAPKDTKWRLVARATGEPLHAVIAVAWLMLDYVSQQEDRGSVANYNCEELAEECGLNADAVRSITAEMVRCGFITDKGRIASWEKRQPQREDDSTERMRAYRARKAAAKGADTAADEEGDSFQTMPYDQYLQTDKWQQKRKLALASAGYRCQVCNADDRELHVHHRTYERRGAEIPEDLTVLCCDCHATFHDVRGMPRE